MRYHSSQQNIVWTVLLLLCTILSLTGCSDANNVTGPPAPAAPAAPGPLTILTSSPLPAGTIRGPYDITLAPSGGTPPYTWSVTPALPNGLTLNTSTGNIAGTPTATGTTPNEFTLQDSKGQSVQKALSIRVNNAPTPLVVLTNSLPSGIVTRDYAFALSGTGGTTLYTWGISSGALPAGLNLDPSGVISGQPTAAGTFSPTFQLQDSGNPPATVTKPLSITITFPAPPRITTASLPPGTFNGAYAQVVSATGGSGALAWAIVGGGLPPGLNLNSLNGNISGAPTQTGSFLFTVRVTDQLSRFDEQSFTITVNPPVLPTISGPSSLPTGTVNQDYPNTTLIASGGTAPLTWDPTVTPALPNGLSWDAAVQTISGTPLNGSQGTRSHTFTVRDSTNPVQTATRTYSLTIGLPAPPTITTTALPNGTVTQPYNRTIQRTGGTPPFTWSVTGTIPPGLNFDSATGGISGTPTTAGTFNFTPQVTDSLSQTDPTPPALSITIVLPAPPNITTTTLANGTIASAYSQTVQATGGTGTLTWSSTGTLPTGLSLSALTGVISGTPTTAGTFNFTPQVTDSLSQTDPTPPALSITIVLPAPPTITTTTLLSGAVGIAYSDQVQATGGIGNLTWSISVGFLPPGLNIDQATGVISGTPTTEAAGQSNFTVRVTDSIPQSDTRNLSITIGP